MKIDRKELEELGYTLWEDVKDIHGNKRKYQLIDYHGNHFFDSDEEVLTYVFLLSDEKDYT
jgi:hypothetical protein